MTSSGHKPKIVFFGSGPVAAKSLELLLKNFAVEAVITKPKPAHHKEDFPVLSLSSEAKLKTFTPNSKSELTKLFLSEAFQSQLGVVIDYGFIIEKSVIDSFELGIINSHFSLLPEWRGADPITFSILSGQDQTGVSLMCIDEQMDTGDLLTQKNIRITPSETAVGLSDKLVALSNEMLSEILPLYLEGKVNKKPQSKSKLITYSRKLTKKDGQLDFGKPATVLLREIHAYSDWPKSRTRIAGKDCVITSAAANLEAHDKTVGSLVANDAKQIVAYCKVGSLVIDELKPAGKPAMSSAAFLAGNQL